MNALAENKTVLAHNDFFEILRNVEYKRLDTHKQVYLDFTGGNLYAKSQILEHQDLLINNIQGLIDDAIIFFVSAVPILVLYGLGALILFLIVKKIIALNKKK